MGNSYRSYLEFATELAFRAGRLTLGYYQTGVRPDLKSDDTPVTVADRDAEALIRGEIEKRYPRHAIVGEEYGMDDKDGASHRWFIDPIDGTKSFVRGVPLYSVLIGLEVEGCVEVGVAYFPALNEMIAAASGEPPLGAFGSSAASLTGASRGAASTSARCSRAAPGSSPLIASIAPSGNVFTGKHHRRAASS